MFKNKILPIIIFILQLLSIGRLWYVHKYGSSKIPSDLIEFIIFSIINAIVLILSYFYYYNSNEKKSFWLFPISVAIISILILIIIFVIMLISKYN